MLEFCLVIPMFAIFIVLMIDLVQVVRTVTAMDAAAYRLARDVAVQGGPGVFPAGAAGDVYLADRLDEYIAGTSHLLKQGTDPVIEYRIGTTGAFGPRNASQLCTADSPVVSVRITYTFGSLMLLDGYDGFITVGRLVDTGQAVAADRCYVAG